MPNQPRPMLHIFTFKEGLLAHFGHDLRLTATRFAITADRGRVHVQVPLDSLSIDGAMKHGVLEPRELDASEKSKILEHARNDVLEVDKDGEAIFEGQARAETPTRLAVSGTLKLHGQTHPLDAKVEVHGAELVATATLRPSTWGIAPFRALAGAVRLEDRVRVEVRAHVPESEAGVLLRSFALSSP